LEYTATTILLWKPIPHAMLSKILPRVLFCMLGMHKGVQKEGETLIEEVSKESPV